jgi:hypothetical protein
MSDENGALTTKEWLIRLDGKMDSLLVAHADLKTEVKVHEEKYSHPGIAEDFKEVERAVDSIALRLAAWAGGAVALVYAGSLILKAIGKG